jgi:hypothetical protein
MDESFIIDDINKLNINNLLIKDEDLKNDPELSASNDADNEGITNYRYINNLNPELCDEEFSSDEEDIKKEIVSNENKKLEKIKIDKDIFYKKMNYNYEQIISQGLLIRNIITFKYNSVLIFYALDLQFTIYDLYLDLTFGNTIAWINYIETNFEK